MCLEFLYDFVEKKGSQSKFKTFFFQGKNGNHKRFYFPHTLKNMNRRLRLRLLSKPFSIQHFSTKMIDSSFCDRHLTDLLNLVA